MTKLILPLVVAGLCASTLLAADAQPKTLLTQRGKLLFSEDFMKPVEQAKMLAKADPKTKTKAQFSDGWRLRPGKWEFVDGAMKGTELAADQHGAVARIPFAFKDAVIQYDVRLDGCKQTTFSVNDAKDHVCRVLINPKGFTVQKDDNDHAGPDKALKFGTVEIPIEPGTWHTVLVEIRGEEMVATIDGKTIAGSHALIGKDKANFGFTVTGDGASVRNLRVWEALPNAQWAKNKKQLSAAK
jgi:hypothetical protein